MPLSYDFSMAKKKLNDKFIQSLKATGKRQEYCDTLLSGFGVRMSKEGKVSYYVRFRYRNKIIRETLGYYPVLSLADARDKARSKLTDVMNGSYSVHQTQQFTIRQAYALFIQLYAKVHNKDWAISDSRLKKFMAEYGDIDLKDLTRRDIIAHLDKLMAQGTPMQSNRAHSALSRFLNWCVERGYLDHSPCQGVKKMAKEISRDRVLNDEEVNKIWNACGTFGYPFGPLFKILMLTAQRRGEVSGMRWSELDIPNRNWTLPKERAKNGKAHIVPLSPQVIKIIESVPRFLHSDYVFTTTGKSPVSGHGKYKYKLDEMTGATDWVFHDFRRTAASGMARLSIPPYVVEKVLNHVSGTFAGVLGVYNQYGYDKEKREALNKWADYVMDLQRNETIKYSMGKS